MTLADINPDITSGLARFFRELYVGSFYYETELCLAIC
jgi:hypothetical protein